MGCRRLKALFGRYPDAEVYSFLHLICQAMFFIGLLHLSCYRPFFLLLNTPYYYLHDLLLLLILSLVDVFDRVHAFLDGDPTGWSLKMELSPGTTDSEIPLYVCSFKLNSIVWTCAVYSVRMLLLPW